jgi:alpha-beta hydrolase superfamily lysophospholipase
MKAILEPGRLGDVVRGLALVSTVAAALVWSGWSLAATPQQLTIPASDGTQLACSLLLPDGTAPAGGWPAVMVFHGLGGTHQDIEGTAAQYFAPAGFASLMCDARGHGASGGLFGLNGPRDVQDTKELFAWLTARPDISDTAVGGLGVSLGGGAVWSAATSGVPFKAIVPMMTWTNLATALAPQGLSKSGLVVYLSQLVPESRWDPELANAKASLLTSTNMGTVTALASTRSPISKLGSLTTPTLLVQGRRDFLFDIDQALAAYQLLKGPKRLYLGELGHAPGADPRTAPDAPTYWAEAVKWLDRFLRGTANGIDKKIVELSHDPYDGKTTTFTTRPPAKTISVALPGTTTMRDTTGKAVRSVRITGGPHETFGASSVTVAYSNAQNWDRLVAVLAVGTTPITAGGVKLTAARGTVTIKLLNEALRVGAGKRLSVYLSSTSTAQSPANALYLAGVQPGAQITIGRATLNLSVLKKTVSR